MNIRAFNRIRVYVAASWRNQMYPIVVSALRAAGHDVLENPEPTFPDQGPADHFSTRKKCV